MAWLLLDSLEQFDRLNKFVNDLFGYPTETTKAYAFPKWHPTENRVAFPVQGDLLARYHQDSGIQLFVQTVVPELSGRLVEDLPPDWQPDGGD